MDLPLLGEEAEGLTSVLSEEVVHLVETIALEKLVLDCVR